MYANVRLLFLDCIYFDKYKTHSGINLNGLFCFYSNINLLPQILYGIHFRFNSFIEDSLNYVHEMLAFMNLLKKIIYLRS